jgi:Fe-S oxidoreductase
MGFSEDEAIKAIQRLRRGEGTDDCLNKCVFCAQCDSRCPVDARPAALLMERLRDRRRTEGHIPEFFAYYLNGIAGLGHEENYFKDVCLASSEETRGIIDKWSEPKQGKDLLWCSCGNRMNPQNIEHSKVLAGLPKFGGVSDCCGVNAAKTGLFDTARHVSNNLIEQLSKSKFERLVVSCGSCLEHFVLLWPEYFGNEFPFQVISLYEYLDEQIEKGKFRVERTVDLDVAISDACYSSRVGENYVNAVKRLCERIGITSVQLEHHGANTACCGMAGYARNLDANGVLDAMKIKATDIEKSGKKDVLNYCMGCHTLMSMVRSAKSHYLLDKVLWALGDEMTSSIHIPDSAKEKAISKFKDSGRFVLPIL